MGFDDGECYICYAIGSGNNPCGRADICFGCLGIAVECIDKPHITARWYYALANAIKEHTISMGICCRCLEDRKALINLSICVGHGGAEYQSDSSDDDPWIKRVCDVQIKDNE